MGKRTCWKKDTSITHIVGIGLYVAMFASPKGHKGNVALFRLFLFSVGTRAQFVGCGLLTLTVGKLRFKQSS